MAGWHSLLDTDHQDRSRRLALDYHPAIVRLRCLNIRYTLRGEIWYASAQGFWVYDEHEANISLGMYGQDDWALLASTVAAVGQYTALLAALSNGLGKSFILLSTDQISTIEKVPMQPASYMSLN